MFYDSYFFLHHGQKTVETNSIRGQMVQFVDISVYGITFLSKASQSGAGDMEMRGVRLFVRFSVSPFVCSRYVVSAVRFLFVDQLISNLYTSIILGISSLSSKLGKIRKKNVRMAAIFMMSAKTHQNFKVLLFQRILIFRRF